MATIKWILITANYANNTLTRADQHRRRVGLCWRPPLRSEPRPESVTAVDINGDSKVDLINANYGDNSLSVLLNTSH